MPLLVLIEGIPRIGGSSCNACEILLIDAAECEGRKNVQHAVSYTFLFFLEVFYMDITVDSLKWPQCHPSTLNFNNVIMGVLMNGSPIYKIPGLRIVAHYIPQDGVDAHVRWDVCKRNREVKGRTLY